MGASLKVNLSGLDKIIKNFNSPILRDELNKIPQEKAIAGLIGQAIAENFSQEGPGWAPLKAKTIRNSVAKKLKRNLSQMTDKEILRHERLARITKMVKENPFRKILQRTGLLKKSVTTPDSEFNIYKPGNKNIIWGTNLCYARTHNDGYPEKNIPKREFLVIKDKWKKQIYEFMIMKSANIIKKVLSGK